MKSLIFKGFCCALLLVYGFGQSQAQSRSERKVSERFPVNSTTTLTLENKFGKVHVNTNQGQEIQVDVTIIGKATSPTKAKQIADGVEIDIRSGNDIQIKTEANSSGSWKNGWGNNGITALTSKDRNSSFEIIYQVSMPKDVPLRIKNNFGDTYLGDHEAGLLLEIGYGHLKTGRLTGKSKKEIEIKFGDGTSQIEFLEIGEVKAAFSDLEIKAAGELEFEGKNGAFEIGRVNRIQGSSAYASFKLGVLEKFLDMTSRFDGSFEVGEVSAGFDRIELESSHGEAEFYFANNASFLFEVETGFGNLKTDGSKTQFTKKIEDNNSAEYAGSYGSQANPSARVEVKAKFSNVSFR